MASTKKPISQKKADREREENKILTRVYYVFLLGLAAECYLFLVYRGYAASTIASALTWFNVLTVGKWIGLAALAAGAVTAYLKREDKKLRTIMTWVAGVGAFFAVSGWVITCFFGSGSGITIACVLVAAAAILTLIFMLYQHECALSTAALCGAMFSVWARGGSFLSEIWAVPVICGCVLGLALLAVAAYLVNLAQKSEGKLKKVQVLSLECDYRVLYAVLGIAAVCVLVGLVVPSINVYLMWILGISLFAEMVYYTTRMM
ncbi:MAG: hypothetical protein K2N78_08110 [Oscillospiraceae bacterium]|nr:hypothetical protein [Oscillospiraceae bacterium]